MVVFYSGGYHDIPKKLDAGQVGSPSLTFQATVRFLGASERMSLRREGGEVRPT